VHRAIPFLMLGLMIGGSPVWSSDWRVDTRAMATRDLRYRLDLYTRWVAAPPLEQDRLRDLDPADGIQLMEWNPYLRARIQLVALLTPGEREALLNGREYVSPPYAQLPAKVQALVDDSALGVHRLDPVRRKEFRYMLRRSRSDEGDHLMISQVDPLTGRPRSGGSIMPGVRVSKP
jgi:hypothetical protein